MHNGTSGERKTGDIKIYCLVLQHGKTEREFIKNQGIIKKKWIL